MLAFFNENIRRGWYKKSFLIQYLSRYWHKIVLFAENDSRNIYVGIFFYLIF